VSYLYQSGYYSYLINVGLGLGEDARVALLVFNLCLLGWQSLGETLLQNPSILFLSCYAMLLNVKKYSAGHTLPTFDLDPLY